MQRHRILRGTRERSRLKRALPADGRAQRRGREQVVVFRLGHGSRSLSWVYKVGLGSAGDQ
jgi:hypothetical protein